MNELVEINEAREPYLKSDPLAPKDSKAWAANLMLASGMISQLPESWVRHKLPEPFDYFNHAGNFSWSLVLAAGASYFAQEQALKFRNIKKERVQKIGIAAGLIVATAANIVTETKYGCGLKQLHGADPIDAYYGFVAAPLGCALIGIRDKTEGSYPDSNRGRRQRIVEWLKA